MGIIGYIHICQKGEWKRSFNMLINSIRQSNLYDNTSVIRIGIVNDGSSLIKDSILQDSKFQVMYLGKSTQYERPTLLHMRASANTDPADTLYYYLHTKGLRHFGKKEEPNVISWINLMLYWNIIRWKYATEILKTFSTYGCEFIGNHYSGNFWWATSSHIKLLPNRIETFYVAPEYWICKVMNKPFCSFKTEFGGGELYSKNISPDKYRNLTNKEAYMTYLKNKNKQFVNKKLKIDMNGINNKVNTNSNNSISTNNSTNNSTRSMINTNNSTNNSISTSTRSMINTSNSISNSTNNSTRSMINTIHSTGTSNNTRSSTSVSASSTRNTTIDKVNTINKVNTTMNKINNFSRRLNNVKTMHKLA